MEENVDPFFLLPLSVTPSSGFPGREDSIIPTIPFMCDDGEIPWSIYAIQCVD